MMDNKIIGVEKTLHYEVTRRDVVRFCQAIGVSCPSENSDGTLTAPPLFCQIFMFEDVPAEDLPKDGSPKELDIPIPAQRTVGGGSEFSIYELVNSGDTITIKSKLKEVSTKQGKSGLLYLVSVETTFWNQHQRKVAEETATFIKKE